MRKCILFNMISLDGFFARPDGSLDWHRVDEEFNAFAVQQLNEAGALVFGRVTYKMMASYWPTPAGIEDDPQVAARMNALPKLVFSSTLPRADWTNTTLLRANPAGEVSARKAQAGKDLFLFGSAVLADALVREGAIDEYRLMLAPVALGSGIPLFRAPLKLKLVRTRPFANGNLLLTYHPE